ncbi:Dyp-type peroxidase [Baekduia sp. Peel2402]|uniref:Dyp-type peroxidase n=1 Tax=Baekduia sp. Peel2402 TaxID=3458296 RepID=UPI00403EDB31
MVIIGADDQHDLADAYDRLKEKLDAHGIVELGVQDGKVRPKEFKGHEHFGYKDGISQPGIRGLTTSSKNPAKSIEPGEFLIGYADEAGHVSGEPEQQEGPPPEAPSSYTPPPPLPAPMPPWAKDGSFLVYRRLRQDVLGFEAFTKGASEGLGLNPDQLGAKLVGRWKSGAAMEPVPALPAGVDPSLADPSVANESQDAHPQVLEDAQINDFTYGGDPGGDKVPRPAHVRKTNPRDQAPPGQAGSDRRRILRRGIPYGPEVEPGVEQPYGGGPVPDTQDRGLLFLCYQASISRGFAFIQKVWVNNDNFPQSGDGHDPIISQEKEPRQFHLPGQANPTDMHQWVFTTGGDYFFSPSIPALKQLAAGTA